MSKASFLVLCLSPLLFILISSSFGNDEEKHVSSVSLKFLFDYKFSLLNSAISFLIKAILLRFFFFCCNSFTLQQKKRKKIMMMIMNPYL